MTFQQKLDITSKKNNSLLCVGLDIDLDKIPPHLKTEPEPIFTFNKAIIDATADLVCCYKPNIAFYETYGIEGLTQLKKTIEYLQQSYPEIPILLDAKRADIGNTAQRYAKAMYEYWNVDSVTVYPYLGLDATLPFFEYKDKCTILLIKTSNPDSVTFQNLQIAEKNKPFYLVMTETIQSWNIPYIGLFVGATYPEELANVRKLFPNSPILTAGIGAQGAKTEQAVKAGIDTNGNNLICNNSREIIYAGNGTDFAVQSRKKAQELRDSINRYRE